MTGRNRTRPAARATARSQSRSSPPAWVYPALAVALALGALLGAITADSDPRSDTQKRIDAMQAADVQRDIEQVGALTDQARRVRDLLGSVLDGMYTALPPGATTPGPLASAGQVDGWKAVTRKAATEFADPPSAGTAVNMARAGLAAGTRQLDLAVDTYTTALQVDADRRGTLLALAARQRDGAIATWSIGATGLDQLNIDTGRGHQHVFLPSAPGQNAMTADGEREGN
ncbi:hypothetical protein ABZS66_36085 [Dactylosporangium sp. NPDC005572]|uniref:hypothetical protein n=1 Tax=Dactylosporangium sp. NPDC005572 TaxID=3156889 RepID=UPI0033BEFE76